MNSLAVIHTGGVGDLVQTFPVLSALGRKWPRAAVTLIGHGERAGLARAGGLADRVVAFETCGLHRLFTADAGAADVPAPLREADLIVTFLARDAFAANLSRLTTARVVPARGLPAPGTCNGPAAQFVYDQVAAQLGLPPREAVPRLRLPENLPEAKCVAARFPDAARAVSIHPGSGSRKKNWPPARFADLAERLSDEGREAIWLLGPAEMECAALARIAASERSMVCAPLVEVAALLSQVRCYVGNDSGVTHLSAALGTPTVAIFGPSDPAVWAPRCENVRTIVAPNGCMWSISVADIVALCADAGGARRGAP